MLKLKSRVDEYFGLEEFDAGSQSLFYGTLGLMFVIMMSGWWF
ncbi:hypothetical protein [Paenibacillus sp. Soil724D2]|nr:hypothetical protein [Paenibacillus sp. Soil724D2]